MADTGWINPGTITEYDTGQALTTPNLIKTQSDSYGYVSLASIKTTYLISAENFSFGIPAGATINGIEVRYERFASSYVSPTDTISIPTLRVHKSGTPSGDDNGGADVTQTSDTDTYHSHGGAADMWSSGYGYADVTNSGFGFYVRAANLGTTRTYYCDHMQIKITYTPSGYGNDVNDISAANIASVNEIAAANIATVNDV